jgi:hypothetical protein
MLEPDGLLLENSVRLLASGPVILSISSRRTGGVWKILEGFPRPVGARRKLPIQCIYSERGERSVWSSNS